MAVAAGVSGSALMSRVVMAITDVQVSVQVNPVKPSRLGQRLSQLGSSYGSTGQRFSQSQIRVRDTVRCSGQTRLTRSTPESTRVNRRVNIVKPVDSSRSAMVRVRLFQFRSMQFGSVRAVRFRVSVNTWSTPVKRQNGSKSQ
ncbi:hypothetical protein Hanom_Chr12g01137911 [Helianthus anomalus]